MQLLLLLQLCYATAAATSAPPPKARHLVLLVVDDLGFGDLGYTGSGIKTPVLDGLAASGVTLGQYYVMRACSPTRASLHTGRFVIRYGMQSGVIETGQAFGLDLGETVLPQALKQAADLEAAAVGIRSREGQQQMQQQMQQQCSAGSLQRGWNCGGGGIPGHLNLNLSTPTDCCAACQQLPACKVWTLYSTSRHHKRCFLKTEQCTPVLSPGSWSGDAAAAATRAVATVLFQASQPGTRARLVGGARGWQMAPRILAVEVYAQFPGVRQLSRLLHRRGAVLHTSISRCPRHAPRWLPQLRSQLLHTTVGRRGDVQHVSLHDSS
jgi:hypothetical protein